MFAFIQKKYEFTDYQIAQLKYTFTIIFSELSKFLIMAVLFHNRIVLYVYAAVLLSVLRVSTGGLHAKTYWGCLLMSLLFFCAAVYLLPQIRISKLWMCILVLGCMAAICLVGPVASVYRAQLDKHRKKRLVFQSLTAILIQLILFWVFDNKLFVVGNWVIVLQTAQLIISKIYKEVES